MLKKLFFITSLLVLVSINKGYSQETIFKENCSFQVSELKDYKVPINLNEGEYKISFNIKQLDKNDRLYFSDDDILYIAGYNQENIIVRFDLIIHIVNYPQTKDLWACP